MKRQQIILLASGILLVAILYFFGNTIPPTAIAANQLPAQQQSPDSANIQGYSTELIVKESKNQLNNNQKSFYQKLEEELSKAKNTNEKARMNERLGRFWLDSVHNHILGAYFIGEAGKLENSEKNLNFAARLLLDNLMSEQNPAMQQYLGKQTLDLYLQLQQLHPESDSIKIAIGAAYLFGNFSDNPMQGISMIREVTDKDSNNTYANLMLGIGGIRSGQYEKAIERFQKVLAVDPENLQAVFYIAETYDRKNDKKNAIKWYEIAEQKVKIPQAKKELRERIKTLQLN